MSKRGFDSTRELKVTLGSQLQQYLAKVALSSGLTELVDLKDRLKHHQECLSIDEKCAGCGVPKNSINSKRECTSCGLIEQCDRPTCPGVEDVHTCCVCGEKEICEGTDSYHINCVVCNGFMCRHCESECSACPMSCKKCRPMDDNPIVEQRKWLSKEAQIKFETTVLQKLCIQCQNNVSYLEDPLFTCQECNDGYLATRQYPPLCRYKNCYAWVCLHKNLHEGYCSKHKEEATIKKPKIE